MGAILVKNYYSEESRPLAVLSDGEKYCNVPVLLSKEVLCRKATVINPIQPYKTMTNTFEIDVGLLQIPDLVASDPKLINCKGSSHIALHVLAPEAFVLTNFGKGGVWAGYIVGYVAKDESRGTFCPMYVNKISDRTFVYAGHKDASDNNQFIKTTIDGKVFAVSAVDYIPTMGFEKVQLLFHDPSYETGSTFSGTINIYCVAV